MAFTRNGTIVARGAFANPATVGTYTPFTLDMNLVSADVPDTAIIQILIVGPVTGVDYHAGSVMQVDSLTFTSGSVSPPRLSIRLNGNSVIVSWPANETGYALQSTQTLNPMAWSNVPGMANSSYQTTPAGTAFYLLIK